MSELLVRAERLLVGGLVDGEVAEVLAGLCAECRELREELVDARASGCVCDMVRDFSSSLLEDPPEVVEALRGCSAAQRLWFESREDGEDE